MEPHWKKDRDQIWIRSGLKNDTFVAIPPKPCVPYAFNSCQPTNNSFNHIYSTTYLVLVFAEKIMEAENLAKLLIAAADMIATTNRPNSSSCALPAGALPASASSSSSSSRGRQLVSSTRQQVLGVIHTPTSHSSGSSSSLPRTCTSSAIQQVGLSIN